MSIKDDEEYEAGLYTPDLPLPELNRGHIEQNKNDISYNRKLIIVFFVAVVALNGVAIKLVSHDIHECENRLYLKLLEKMHEQP